MELSRQLHAPVALPPGKENPGTNLKGGRMGSRAGLDAVEKRKLLPLLGIETLLFSP
jgi:hypothetical protein